MKSGRPKGKVKTTPIEELKHRKLVTLQELMVLYGIPYYRVSKWVEAGLPYIKTTHGKTGKKLFPVDAVDEWLKKNLEHKD